MLDDDRVIPKKIPHIHCDNQECLEFTHFRKGAMSSCAMGKFTPPHL